MARQRVALTGDQREKVWEQNHSRSEAAIAGLKSDQMMIRERKFSSETVKTMQDRGQLR